MSTPYSSPPSANTRTSRDSSRVAVRASILELLPVVARRAGRDGLYRLGARRHRARDGERGRTRGARSPGLRQEGRVAPALAGADAEGPDRAHQRLGLLAHALGG